MHFFNLLKSIDDILYEIALWLVLYPLTLWRTLRHPRQMMEYGAAQLKRPPSEQYRDSLSPPIFLFLTVFVAAMLELSFVGENKLIQDTDGMAGLISDEPSLIGLRVIAFATFPIFMAVRTVVLSGGKLGRDSLQQPFFAQCYATVPFTLILSLAGTVAQLHSDWAPPLAVAMVTAAIVGFLALEAGWFAKIAGKGLGSGLWNAVVGLVQCLLFLTALIWMLGNNGI